MRSAHAAARRDPGRTGPGRSLRGRSSSTHHQGSRPAAGSRSAPGSTPGPSVGADGAHVDGQSSSPQGRPPPHRRAGRSCLTAVPERNHGAGRCWRAWRPWDAAHVGRHATAPWSLDTPACRYVSQRSGVPRVRSSTEPGGAGGRSLGRLRLGRGGWRSPRAQRTIGSALTAAPDWLLACHHLHGTSVLRRLETHRPPQRHPRSTTLLRSPARTVGDAHDAQPVDGLETASPAFLSPSPPTPVTFPSQPLTSRRCDDHLNPPSTRRGPSGTASAPPACSARWAGSRRLSTTR